MSRSRFSPALRATLLLATTAAAAQAGGTSPWIKGAQSEVRLLAAGDTSGGALLAGAEVHLQRHFITYWRDPGDAGVPPTFSFQGSTNLKSAAVRYPAPTRLDEAGATAFGYEDDVVFPVLVQPEDPSRPVALAVTLDYAVCHDICLPAHADLRMMLDREGGTEAARVRDALAAVPRPAAVGETRGQLEIRSVSAPDAEGNFTVATTLPQGVGTLFVEAPEGWAYAAAGPVFDGPDRAVFPVKRLDGPKGERRPSGPLTLTLTSKAGAIEAAATLDGGAAKP